MAALVADPITVVGPVVMLEMVVMEAQDLLVEVAVLVVHNIATIIM
jgi:hypothetical protein